MRVSAVAMRLCTRALVYVPLRVTAVALDATAPTNLMSKRARAPTRATCCEFLSLRKHAQVNWPLADNTCIDCTVPPTVALLMRPRGGGDRRV